MSHALTYEFSYTINVQINVQEIIVLCFSRTSDTRNIFLNFKNDSVYMSVDKKKYHAKNCSVFSHKI